ncbi:eCIS core domain-containing protein [Deinococcus ficus]|uniref:eCIS core domain-containing protein n=1 Tax=Deinococcus ficus TaxID=317577 RepID=UPI00174C5979|nr:DUF4157 domain-containing protein [Deinococcus ficus]GHF79523.1 hypothetical protein GCM10017782_16750 [Deinococcus ficus]
MEYQRKRPLTPSAGPHQTVKSGKTLDTIPHAPVQRVMQRFTSTPTTAQRQAAQPVLRAASLQRQEEETLSVQRLPLQRQVDALATTLPAGAVPSALQRQASERVSSVPARPQTAGDWVTIMRHQAEQVQGSRMDARTTQAFTTLQRQVTGALVQSVKLDPRPAIQRHAEFAQHAIALQRHALTNHIPRAALAQLPPGERLSLQRAVDDAVQADALQRQQDEQALKLHSLQRQLAELDEQATKPVMDRIQARRGSGNPLPAAVQRHLERGLNHDLSAVRIHDDAEADKLAKGVNATAFTTGTDIYFRSGTFNPNTQSGLELLAHEVTHTVQQSQGKVGKGIDPDSGLEQEARKMGKRLADTGSGSRHHQVPFRLRQSPSKLAIQRNPDADEIRKKAEKEIANATAGRNKVSNIGQVPKVYTYLPLVNLYAGAPKGLSFDHGFLEGDDGNLDYRKLQKPTLKDHANKTYWMTKVRTSLLLRPDLVDANYAYIHFLMASGKSRDVNYERFVKNDAAGKRMYESIVSDIRYGIRDKILFNDKLKSGKDYKMSGSTAVMSIGTSSRFPYPATENWQKTIGAHPVWANVHWSFKYNSKQAFNITASIEINMKDMYNFNPRQSDIATRVPDSANGRFEITGLGKEYINFGKIKRQIQIILDPKSLETFQKSQTPPPRLLLPNPR